MFTKQQITEIKKGIKLAVKQLNLDTDKLFANSENEIKSIDNKINTIINKEKSYLTTIGYEITLSDVSVTGFNLQEKLIHEFIYSRNEEMILDAININEIIKLNN